VVVSGKMYIQRGGQRGAGFGKHLMSLFRRAVPYLKSGAKAAAQSLIKGGVGVLKDVVVDKKKVGAAFKERGSEVATDLTNKAEKKVKKMVGGRRRKSVKRGGVRRKRHSSSSGVKRRRGRPANISGSGRKRKRYISRKRKVSRLRKKKDLFTSYSDSY